MCENQAAWTEQYFSTKSAKYARKKETLPQGSQQRVLSPGTRSNDAHVGPTHVESERTWYEDEDFVIRLREFGQEILKISLSAALASRERIDH
jgi:hypothetical protein